MKASQIILVLFVGALLVFSMSSCNEKAQKDFTKKQDKLESEWVGNVGRGYRGDFNVFKFKVDGITYLVASESNGGMTLLDKSKK